MNVVHNYDGRWAGVVVRMTCQLNGELGWRITQRLCPAGQTSEPMSFTVVQPAPFNHRIPDTGSGNVYEEYTIEQMRRALTLSGN